MLVFNSHNGITPTFTFRRDRLYYLKSSTKNEFWSALLEKAYAKLHGGYTSLNGGNTLDAMVDFTGGCSENFILNLTAGNMFNIMMKGYARSSLMACSVSKSRHGTGIVEAHAYSLTKVLKATIGKENDQQLVRIRNPWGKTEWSGAWSDGSEEWKDISERDKEGFGLTFDNDGEFYMSQRDFLKQFETLQICNLNPDSLSEEDIAIGKLSWHRQHFYGSWTAGKTAGEQQELHRILCSEPANQGRSHRFG